MNTMEEKYVRVYGKDDQKFLGLSTENNEERKYQYRKRL